MAMLPSPRSRRQVLRGLGAFGGAMMAVASTPAAALLAGSARDLSFVARRNGSKIGEHHVRFDRLGEQLRVAIDIRFDVTFGFIPLYRYRHSNRELWQAGRLVEMDARTDDDGTEHWVRAERHRDRLIATSSAGRLDLPADTVPTSYWNEATLLAGQWLDTQTGRLAQAEVSTHPPEPVRAYGRVIMARRYRLVGDVDCQLWYHGGRWVRLEFQASDGSTIDYQTTSMPA